MSHQPTDIASSATAPPPTDSIPAPTATITTACHIRVLRIRYTAPSRPTALTVCLQTSIPERDLATTKIALSQALPQLQKHFSPITLVPFDHTVHPHILINPAQPHSQHLAAAIAPGSGTCFKTLFAHLQTILRNGPMPTVHRVLFITNGEQTDVESDEITPVNTSSILSRAVASLRSSVPKIALSCDMHCLAVTESYNDTFLAALTRAGTHPGTFRVPHRYHHIRYICDALLDALSTRSPHSLPANVTLHCAAGLPRSSHAVLLETAQNLHDDIQDPETTTYAAYLLLSCPFHNSAYSPTCALTFTDFTPTYVQLTLGPNTVYIAVTTTEDIAPFLVSRGVIMNDGAPWPNDTLEDLCVMHTSAVRDAVFALVSTDLRDMNKRLLSADPEQPVDVDALSTILEMRKQYKTLSLAISDLAPLCKPFRLPRTLLYAAHTLLCRFYYEVLADVTLIRVAPAFTFVELREPRRPLVMRQLSALQKLYVENTQVQNRTVASIQAIVAGMYFEAMPKRSLHMSGPAA